MKTEKEKIKDRLELNELKIIRLVKALLLIEGIVDDCDFEHIGKETRIRLQKIVKIGLGQR